jgi:hypothetical protein
MALQNSDGQKQPLSFQRFREAAADTENLVCSCLENAFSTISY